MDEILNIVVIIIFLVLVFPPILIWASLRSHINQTNQKIDSLTRDINRFMQEKKPLKEQSAEPIVQPKPESINGSGAEYTQKAESIVQPKPESINGSDVKYSQKAESIVQPKPEETYIPLIDDIKTPKEQKPVDMPPVPRTSPAPPVPVFLPEEKIYKPEEKPAEKVVASFQEALRAQKKNSNFEKFIGENLFGKIGILILIIGVGLFVKYAIDQNWINEVFRTILGFATGSALLFIAERLRLKYRPFSSLLAGGAFAIFYVTVAIAYHYYALFSQPVAFGILVAITIGMSALAILYDRRELAIIALVGGFIAPFLVSSGDGSIITFYTYILILNLGMFGLSLYKKWEELPMITFGCTSLVMLIFTVGWMYGTHEDSETVALKLFVFATLFFLIFFFPVVSILKNEKRKINIGLLGVIIINNFFYLGFGLYFLHIMDLPFKVNGLLPLFIAIVNLAFVGGLWKQNRNFKLLVYTLLGLTLTFVSLAIPLQLEGNRITLFWASEMVLLLWLYTKSKIRLFEYYSVALIFLTAISFIMDVSVERELTNSYGETYNVPFSQFIVNLFVGIAYGACALLIQKKRELFETARILKYKPWNAALIILSSAVIYYSCMLRIQQSLYDSDYLYQVLCLFTIAYMLLLVAVLHKRFPVGQFPKPYLVGSGLAVLIFTLNSFAEHSDIRFPLWLSALCTVSLLLFTAKLFYAAHPLKSPENKGFTIYIAVLAMIVWVVMIDQVLRQLLLFDERSAGFSIAVGIAGFVLMSVGMKLHLKTLRITSLAAFGIVLFKLVAIDLWSMPTIGKIITFVFLGAILLVLSFLYQKLKNVLFEEDNQKEEDNYKIEEK